jgi:hypothetical protein
VAIVARLFIVRDQDYDEHVECELNCWGSEGRAPSWVQRLKPLEAEQAEQLFVITL